MNLEDLKATAPTKATTIQVGHTYHVLAGQTPGGTDYRFTVAEITGTWPTAIELVDTDGKAHGFSDHYTLIREVVA